MSQTTADREELHSLMMKFIDTGMLDPKLGEALKSDSTTLEYFEALLELPTKTEKLGQLLVESRKPNLTKAENNRLVDELLEAVREVAQASKKRYLLGEQN